MPENTKHSESLVNLQSILYSNYSTTTPSSSNNTPNSPNSINTPNSETVIISGFKSINKYSINKFHSHRLIYEISLLVVYAFSFLFSGSFIFRHLFLSETTVNHFCILNIIATLLLILPIIKLLKYIRHNFNNNYPPRDLKIYNIIYLSSFLIIYIDIYMISIIINEIDDGRTSGWKRNFSVFFLRFIIGFVIFVLFILLCQYWVVVKKYNKAMRKISRQSVLV